MPLSPLWDPEFQIPDSVAPLSQSRRTEYAAQVDAVCRDLKAGEMPDIPEFLRRRPGKLAPTAAAEQASCSQGSVSSMKRLHLYFEDSGVRQPDKNPQSRRDRMDYFALGGILIREENIGVVIEAHRAFTARWEITAPLHSTRIRGRRGAFAWLGTDKNKADDFLLGLETMILELPVVGIACVVDRPGYMARYAERYKEPWLLCKTAFAILAERAAKYASQCGAQLEIYFEESGEHEDRAIQSYAQSLREDGMPFDTTTSSVYQSLRADDFKSIIVGQPQRVTKKVPAMQISDLVLYPMAKGGYDRVICRTPN